jgi:hypothetical protein
MKEVIYKRLPIEYSTQEISQDEHDAVIESRRGVLLTLTTEISWNQRANAPYSTTVAYIADSEDGMVSRISPFEMIIIVGDLN